MSATHCFSALNAALSEKVDAKNPKVSRMNPLLPSPHPEFFTALNTQHDGSQALYSILRSGQISLKVSSKLLSLGIVAHEEQLEQRGENVSTGVTLVYTLLPPAIESGPDS